MSQPDIQPVLLRSAFRRRPTLWAVLLLGLAVGLSYASLHGNGFVGFDDDQYIFNNPFVRNGFVPGSVGFAFTSFVHNHWHPLTWMSLMLTAEWFGPDPAAFHLGNLLIHFGSVVLLFLALRRMTGAYWPSLGVALLFGLHPMNVEAVAWAAERKTVLGGMFGLAALYCWSIHVRRENLPAYAGAVLCMALSLMSKPVFITLPFLLLLLDYWPLGRLRMPGAPHDLPARAAAVHGPAWLLLEKSPFFVLTAMSLLMSWGMAAQMQMKVALPDLSLRAANAAVSLVRYVGLLVWPGELTFFHPYPPSVDPAVLAGALVVLAAAAGLALWKMRTQPQLIVGWLWYAGTMVPVLGFVQIGKWPAIADRHMYVPMIGIWLLLAFSVVRITSVAWRRRAVLGVAVAACAFGMLTWLQADVWKNDERLFTHGVQVDNGNYLAYGLLGRRAMEQGRLGEAARYFIALVGTDPSSADGFADLGAVFLMMGDDGQAEKALARARDLLLRGDPMHRTSTSLSVYANLAEVYRRTGRPGEAVRHLQAIAWTGDPGILASIGKLFRDMDACPAATPYLLWALRTDGAHLEARAVTGACLVREGRVAEGRAMLEQVLADDPGQEDARQALEGLDAQGEGSD